MHVASLETPMEHGRVSQAWAGGFSPSFDQSAGPDTSY